MSATEQQLSDDLDAIKTGVDSALAQIADLKTQIANLGTGLVSQQQLDDLTAKADAIVATLNPPAATPAAS